MTKVIIEFQRASQGRSYDKCLNVYTKGGLVCILWQDENKKQWVHKYPLNSVFRIIEEY